MLQRFLPFVCFRQGVTDVLCEACDQLGWKSPTKIQIEAIPVALQGEKSRLPLSVSFTQVIVHDHTEQPYAHFWTSGKIQPFWNKILFALREIFSYVIPTIVSDPLFGSS